MDAVFPAKIRRFVAPDAFEADIDLYFGVFARKVIHIVDSSIDLSLDPQALTGAYEGRVVYLHATETGMRSEAIRLPVSVRTDLRHYRPFVPKLRR
jgi:hypothetical protein